MANVIKWRTTLREGKLDKPTGIGYLEWRKYSNGSNVLISASLEPKSDSEKELAIFLAEEKGLACYEGTEFMLDIKDDIRLNEFQEKVERMFKTIEEFQNKRKSVELLSVRIPKWIRDDVFEVKGNDVKFSEVVKDALVLWSKNQKEKKIMKL